MTDRDLSALLERAAEDVVELDFVENAWNAALEGRRCWSLRRLPAA